MVVHPAHEHVNAVRSPRHCGWGLFEGSAKGLPIVPLRSVPPLMDELPACSLGKDIETVWSPRTHCRAGRKGATEVLPAAPLTAIPPKMAQVVVHPAHEHVNAVRSPRHCRWTLLENPAKGLKIVPGRPVPPFVIELIVRSRGKYIKPVRSPGCHRRRCGDRPAKILPPIPFRIASERPDEGSGRDDRRPLALHSRPRTCGVWETQQGRIDREDVVEEQRAQWTALSLGAVDRMDVEMGLGSAARIAGEAEIVASLHRRIQL